MMISINHTPCHHGNYSETSVIYPLKESRWATDVYILKESKWAKGQGGLLLFTPRQSQNGKGSRWAAVVYPLTESI